MCPLKSVCPLFLSVSHTSLEVSPSLSAFLFHSTLHTPLTQCPPSMSASPLTHDGPQSLSASHFILVCPWFTKKWLQGSSLAGPWGLHATSFVKLLWVTPVNVHIHFCTKEKQLWAFSVPKRNRKEVWEYIFSSDCVQSFLCKCYVYSSTVVIVGRQLWSTVTPSLTVEDWAGKRTASMFTSELRLSLEQWEKS